MIPIMRKNLSCLFESYASCQSQRIYRSVSLFCLFSTCSKGGKLVRSAIVDLLQHKHQFSSQVASKAAAVLHRVNDHQRVVSILSFLRDSGFSNAQLEKMTKYRPRVLLSSLENRIKPNVWAFRELGFSSDDIAEIMSRNPSILQLDLNTRFIPSFSMLKGLLGTNDAVARLLRGSGSVLYYIETTMSPNIEFLKSCGVPMERILKLVCRYPRCLLMKPEVIRKSVEKAEEMGVNRSSNMFIYALQVVSSTSGKTLELKLQAFRDCGFSESDIFTMLGNSPQTLGVSVNKLHRIKDVILATGKYDLSCIVNNPTSLTCSIEKRYKPRFKILEILESKNLIKDWPTLGTVASLSNEKFFKSFVGPHLSELGTKDTAAKSSPQPNIEN